MIIRTLTLFDRFRCAGGACKDTCCVRDKLELDNKTYFEYQRVIAKGDAFGRRMVASISERNGVACFRMRENGECPFLMRDRRCELYIRLGPDKISETCRKYPTYAKEYGNYRETGCRFSCPEVLRLVLTHPEKFEIRARENDTEPISFKNLNADLLPLISPVREAFLNIAQDARNSLQATTTLLLKLASEVQNVVDRKAYGELAALVAPFDGDDPTGGIEAEVFDSVLRDQILEKQFKLLCKLEYRKKENADRFAKAYRFFKSESPADRRAREIGFASFMREREYEYRKWLFYLFHRDLLDVVFDGQFYSRVRLAALSTFLLFELGSLEWKRCEQFTPQMQEELFRNYAREIDENPRNAARIQKKLRGSAYAHPKLLRALSPMGDEKKPVSPVNPVGEPAETE